MSSTQPIILLTDLGIVSQNTSSAGFNPSSAPQARRARGIHLYGDDFEGPIVLFFM